jgi:glycosyltransferase involved in cell wall biosynthesis
LKLLILSQYFPPEIGAPQNRLFDLAVRLRNAGVEVTVLTAMPNYPQMEIHPDYRDKKYFYEEMQGIKVHRSSIFVSSSRSIINRLRNYFSFVFSSMRAGSRLEDRYDFLLCESPPLFLGYSALFLARKKKARLIFNVSDLWPESAEKLGVVTNKTLLRFAYNLEARLYKSSALVTGQTEGICNDIRQRFPQVKTYWLPNGVDLDFYDPAKISSGSWRQKHGFSESQFIFLYAGIIGIAQGLDVVLKAAALLKNNNNIRIVLMGSGPEKEKLIRLKSDLQLSNVHFDDAVPKSEMPEILKNVNAAIIPLRRLELFMGAIPSKIFEAQAMEVPILLGVDGEARELFINRGKGGKYFEPENESDLAREMQSFAGDPGHAKQLGLNGRVFVSTHFNREKIAASFLEKLKSL